MTLNEKKEKKNPDSNQFTTTWKKQTLFLFSCKRKKKHSHTHSLANVKELLCLTLQSQPVANGAHALPVVINI